jgi:DNA-binding GntR family transcriptional regulator
VPDDWLNSIWPVQHGSGTAAWLQIRADLFMRISKGDLAPGDVFPSEPALARAYAVSRLTVRRALEDLARGGYIRTDHGVGSYVAPTMMRHRIDDGNASLFESMASLGHSVRQLVLVTRDLRLTQLRAPEHLLMSRGLDDAEDLEFSDFPGPMREYQYVRWVDEIPWSLSYALVPACLAPRHWDGSTSLFESIAQLNGLVIHRHERRFSAVPAEEEDARWLEVATGSPLLLLNGTNSDQNGRAVARVVHHIRGDRAQYAVRIPG